MEGIAFVQSVSDLDHVLWTMKLQRDADPKRHTYHLQLLPARPREICTYKNNLRYIQRAKKSMYQKAEDCFKFQLLPTLRPRCCHHSHENNMFSCCRAPYASPNANVYITAKKMCSVIIHPEGETIVVISRVTEYTESSNCFSTLQRVHHQCKLI